MKIKNNHKHKQQQTNLKCDLFICKQIQTKYLHRQRHITILKWILNYEYCQKLQRNHLENTIQTNIHSLQTLFNKQNDSLTLSFSIGKQKNENEEQKKKMNMQNASSSFALMSFLLTPFRLSIFLILKLFVEYNVYV